MTINIGLLGAGRWGSHLIRKFMAEPRVQVRAIADPYPPNLERAQQQHDFAEGTRLLRDWRELVNLPGLDAIVVATPAATHFSIIQAAFEQGLHVMAEKPLTLTPQESHQLCDLAQQKDCLLVVDHTYLFNPAIEAAKAVVEAGHLGNLRYGYASRTHLCPVRQDVDALWDLAIHDIAIFNYWLDATPVEAQAQGNVWLQPQLQTRLSPQGLADTVWAGLNYPTPKNQGSENQGAENQGAENQGSERQDVEMDLKLPVQIHLSWLNPDKQRRLVLVGDRAALVFDELADDPVVLMRGQLECQEYGYVPTELLREVIEVPAGEPLQKVCAHFVDCVERHQVSGRSSGRVGAQLVEVLTALSQSMIEGRPVTLEAF